MQWDKNYRIYVDFEMKGRVNGQYESDTVKVEVSDGRRCYELKQIVHHSPTGMSSGYAGSGPADLALTILADHFEEKPAFVKKVLEGGYSGPERISLAVRYYQMFKNMSKVCCEQLVTRSSEEGQTEFNITQAEIREIIERLQSVFEAR